MNTFASSKGCNLKVHMLGDLLYWVLQLQNFFQLQNLFFCFFSISTSLVTYSFCSFILLLNSMNYLSEFSCFLVAHWVSSQQLFWILYLLDHNTSWLSLVSGELLLSFRNTVLLWFFMVLGELFLWQHIWNREHISYLGEPLFNLILKINRLIIIGLSLFLSWWFYSTRSGFSSLSCLWLYLRINTFHSPSPLPEIVRTCASRIASALLLLLLLLLVLLLTWCCLWRHQVGRHLHHAQGHLGCGHCHCRRGRLVGREQGQGCLLCS